MANVENSHSTFSMRAGVAPDRNAKQHPMQGPRLNVACDDRLMQLECIVSAIQCVRLRLSLTESLDVFNPTW